MEPPPNKIKFVGVIPCRYGSTRFPGKPLIDILGKTMVERVIEGVAVSQKLTQIIVATDDVRIAEKVDHWTKSENSDRRVSVKMTDSHLPSGTDRVFAAIQDIDCDVAINIQGDEPLVMGEWIDGLVEIFLADKAPKITDMATLAHPISLEEINSPHSVKVILNQEREAIYFSRFPIPYSRTDLQYEKSPFICLKHIGMYAYRKDFLKKFCSTPPALIESAESLEQLRALFMGARIKVMEVARGFPGVDTPEDLKRVIKIITQNQNDHTKKLED